MAFTPKVWHNDPDSGVAPMGVDTPLDAADLVDLETRLSNYTDSRTTGAELLVNKDVANGYAGLNSAGKLPWASLAGSFYIVTDVAFGADNTGVADSRPAIQAALNAASSAGGGVVYVPPGTYKISTSTESGVNGGVILVPPGVSFIGAGSRTVRFNYGTGFGRKAVRALGTLATGIAITGDIAFGDANYTVSSSASFTVGDSVVFRIGDMPGDTPEAITWGFARVITIPDGTHVTLDYASKIPVTVASVTNNKHIYRVTASHDRVRIGGFSMIGPQADKGSLAYGTHLSFLRDPEVFDIYGELVGSGVVYTQYVEGGRIDGLRTDDQSYVTDSNQGRAISCAETRGLAVHGIRASNCSSQFINVEASSEVTFYDTVINNSAAARASDASALISMGNRATATFNRLVVRGKHTTNGGNLSLVAAGTVIDFQIRDLTLDLTGEIFSWSLSRVRGLVRIRRTDGSVRQYDFDRREQHTIDIDATTVTSSTNFYFRDGILVATEIYVTAGVSSGTGAGQAEVFIGRTSDNSSQPGFTGGTMRRYDWSGAVDGARNTWANEDQAVKALLKSFAPVPAGSRIVVTCWTVKHRLVEPAATLSTSVTDTVANEPGSEQYQRFTPDNVV